MKKAAAVIPCFLLALSFVLPMQSVDAQEARHFEEALYDLEVGTWVVVDIDDTLIAPAQMVGSTDWGHHVYDQLVQDGMPPDKAWEESSRRLYTAQAMSEVQPIEAHIPALLADLQKHGVTVLALTARPSTFSKETKRQLASVGIDLSRTAPHLAAFSLRETDPSPTYCEGVLYTYRVPKGEALKEFFCASGLRPERVIFIDDSAKHIASVESVMQVEGVNCEVFHYRASDDKRAGFDPEIADFQWRMLGRILSDEQARRLLNKG